MDLSQSLIDECEALIRLGRDSQVNRLLSKLNTAQIPRPWRLPLANICRRTSNISMGLRILTSVVRRHKESIEPPATAAELAEYSILLQRSGSVSEAMSLLDQISSTDFPNVYLYKAFCHFNSWEYEDAVPYLKRFIELPISPYFLLIGKVNLAAAYVALNYFELAEPLLKQCIESATSSENTRLKANCHELLSQVYIFKAEFEAADAHLRIAETSLNAPESLDQLLIEKCKAFLDSSIQQSTEALVKFRSQALAWPHAETVRETDFFRLMVTCDEGLLRHLVFGTPFQAYRTRVLASLKQSSLILPEPYIYTGENCESLNIRRLDISDPESTAHYKLKFGSASHKVLDILVKDFYRPVTVNSLFSKLFPDEYFNIFSSPTRIHQAVNRVRRWIEDQDLPLSIHNGPLGYSLTIDGDFSLRLPLQRSPVDSYQQFLRQLHALYGERDFRAEDAGRCLHLSNSSVRRYLNRGKKNGDIQSFGAGSSTVYFLKTNTFSVSA